MLSQQEMIRGLMKVAGMTRDRFCEVYEVSRRALDCWLLPSDSKGFRVASESFMGVIESDLVELLDGVIPVAPSVSDEVMSSLVSFHNGVKKITFPPLYFVKYTCSLDDDLIPFLKDYQPGQKTYVTEAINLDGKPDNLFNLISHESELLLKPRSFSDRSANPNFWVYIFHFNSKAACRTTYDVTAQVGTLDNSDIFGSVCFQGEYFYMVARPAEKHYDKPLFIYTSRFLKKDLHLSSEIYYEYWDYVMDEHGNEIKMPIEGYFNEI